MLESVFWISLISVVYVYFGYPIILFILSTIFTKPVNKQNITPTVSIVISVHNEEGTIKDKILNCLELDYPKENIEIMIGSDSSADKTNEIIREYVGKGIKFYRFDTHRGKVSVLNDLVPKAQGEIIVFTDARQLLEKNAIKELVKNFSDVHIGAVSGELFINKVENSDVGVGTGLYWNYEKFLRKKESQIGSTVGATGAIYAIRKNLYYPPKPDTLLDDVFIPIKIVGHGYRVVFDPLAKAYDICSKTSSEEASRKLRTLVGNWQIFFRIKDAFNPIKSKIAWQLFSHKLLRIMIPYFLVIILAANLLLLKSEFYRLFLMLQIVFYLSALIGKFSEKGRRTVFNIPYTFCMLNYQAGKSLFIFLTNQQKVTWK